MSDVGSKVPLIAVVAALAAYGWVASEARGEAGTAASRPVAADRLEAVVEIEGGRRPARQLLRAVAEQASLVLLIDPAADPAALAGEIDLELRHSRAREALGWIVDLTGLRVYLVGEALLVAGVGEGPALLGAVGGLWAKGAGPGRRQEELLERVGRVDLVDASVSAAVRVLRKVFRVDILLAPPVLDGQELVSVAGELRLREALEEVCRQAGGAWRWRRGAIWVGPKGGEESKGADDLPGRKRASGDGEGLRSKSGRYHMTVRGVRRERVLTHLEKLYVNRYQADRPDSGRVVTVEALGTAGELVDLIRSVPD